jgi:uracil-DNA glycosylase
LKLQSFLANQRALFTACPPPEDVFAALRLTSYADTRVLILGQDPYHGQGQAHGLAFSVRDGVRPPPSLRNIFKELSDDWGRPTPVHSNLESWARQGVLLLNTILTVRAGAAGSHWRQGWETFTGRIVELVAQKRDRVVFLLWGKQAQRFGSQVDTSRHTVICAAHPSPRSARLGFFGSRPFTRANAALLREDFNPIEWTGAGAVNGI